MKTLGLSSCDDRAVYIGTATGLGDRIKMSIVRRLQPCCSHCPVQIPNAGVDRVRVGKDLYARHLNFILKMRFENWAFWGQEVSQNHV